MASIEYLAGFIDGEGHVSLARIPRQNRSREYCVRLAISNTNQRILEEIREEWGGHLSTVGPRKPGWKPGHELIWTNAAAGKLLARVAPYLNVKSEQEIVLRDFLSHLRECRRTRDGHGHLLPLSRRNLNIREAFYKRLKLLNRRGSFAASWRESNIGRGLRRRNPSPEYLAGFLDAEGSLMIAKSKDRRYHGLQYRPRISASNTDKAVLEDLQRIYGGILTNQPAPKAGWKHVYQLVWTDGRVDQLLSIIRPHLHVKRKQAEVMVDFVRHRKRTRQGRQGRNGRFFGPLPAEVIAHREILYRRMRKLNAKGVRLHEARI